MSYNDKRSEEERTAIQEAAADWIAREDAGFTPAEKVEFQRWLDRNPAHVAVMERYRATWRSLDSPYKTGSTGAFIEGLAARGGRRRRRRLVAVAGAALIMVGVGVWTRAPAPGEAEVLQPSAGGAVVHLPRQQALPDGSSIEFRPGAIFRAVYGEKERRVVLVRGEAHFKVEKDSARPFLVEARGIAVRAVGTAFSVNLEASAVEVVVTEGSVTVQKDSVDDAAIPSPEDDQRTLARLEAGNMVVVDFALGAQPVPVMPVSATDMAQRMSWRSPRVEFTRTRLGDAVALLNAQNAGVHGVRFIIDDPEIAAVQIGGLFRTDNTEAFVQILHTGFGIEAVPKGNSETLLRRRR